jgi:hypothetical protein
MHDYRLTSAVGTLTLRWLSGGVRWILVFFRHFDFRHFGLRHLTVNSDVSSSSKGSHLRQHGNGQNETKVDIIFHFLCFSFICTFGRFFWKQDLVRQHVCTYTEHARTLKGTLMMYSWGAPEHYVRKHLKRNLFCSQSYDCCIYHYSTDVVGSMYLGIAFNQRGIFCYKNVHTAYLGSLLILIALALYAFLYILANFVKIA